MSDTKQHFQTPKTFSSAELDSRKERAKDRILNGYHCSLSREWRYPAINHLVFNSYEQVLRAVAEQTKAGNELFTGHILRMPMPGFFEAMFYKPKAEIDYLLKAEYERVEAEYRQELQEDLEQKQALLAEQLFNQQLAREEKEKQKKLDQARAKAETEAAEYIKSLMTK